MNSPRFDLYASIHKALRMAMSDTLTRLGSLDVEDAGARHDAVAAVRDLLDLLRSHVHKENLYVHTLLEARSPGVSQRIAGEHREHLAHIDALEEQTVAFHCAPDVERAFRLYRQLSLFVAENFEHMDVEETLHNAALWATCSDEELLQVEAQIVASLTPDDLAQALHWMLPAMNHGERVAMLAGMRSDVPAPVFADVMQLAERRLPAREWAKLQLEFMPRALAA